jgi:hypothetical protein
MGSGIPVIGFGSPNVEVGNMYEVPLKASGKRSITVNALEVETVFNKMGPPAKCPHNITWRFQQSRGSTAWNLHQPGCATNVCIGIDYPFLQPRHLEWEMRGSPLHLHTSVFGGGLILCSVDLPEKSPTLDEPRVDKEILDEPALDEPALEEPALDKPALDEPALDEPALGKPALGKPALGKPALGKPALGKPALGKPALGKQALGEPALGGSALDESAWDKKSAAPMTQPRGQGLRGWPQVGLAMMAMLCLTRQERLAMGFITNDCANTTTHIDAYSLAGRLP